MKINARSIGYISIWNRQRMQCSPIRRWIQEFFSCPHFTSSSPFKPNTVQYCPALVFLIFILISNIIIKKLFCCSFLLWFQDWFVGHVPFLLFRFFFLMSSWSRCLKSTFLSYCSLTTCRPFPHPLFFFFFCLYLDPQNQDNKLTLEEFKEGSKQDPKIVQALSLYAP